MQPVLAAWVRTAAVRRGIPFPNGIVCLFVLLLGCSLAAQAQLQAGAARESITPDISERGIPLGGYAARLGAPAVGVHDPVYARAVVLSQSEKRAAIVSLDLCFLPANIRDEVLKRLVKQDPRWQSNELFLSATHTHSAPDPLAMHAGNHFSAKGWTPFDAKLLSFTAEHIAAAVLAAAARLRPVTLSAATAPFPTLNRNRRGDKVTDPDLTILRLTDLQAKPVAAIVNFAAHPTLYDDKMMQVSADWPGAMAAELETGDGGLGVCLFLNGAEGDASPNGVDDKQGEAKVVAYGGLVADAVRTALKSSRNVAMPVLSMRMIDVALPPRRPNALFYAAAGKLGLTFAQARSLVESLMPTHVGISLISMGPVLMMGFPCEPAATLGLAAKAAARRSGYATPLVSALTNAWLAYALTPEQYHKGDYEAGMSFYGDQFGPALLDGLNAGLKQPKPAK